MKVAVAIIYDEYNRVLITQRPMSTSHGGFWEFPGGKLEVGENPREALIREIKEEIGIHVELFEHFIDVEYQYLDKDIQLIVFKVYGFTGIPSCKEGQLNMQWVSLEEVGQYSFPKANTSIIEALRKVEV